MTRKWPLATSLLATSLLAQTSLADEVALIQARHNQVVIQGYPEPANYTVHHGRLARREAKTERIGDQIVTTLDTRIDPSLQASYIHHEYAHACQMMMGGPSLSVFMDESSATLQEMLAFKEGGAWHSSVQAFQAKPHIPPLVDVGEDSKFEYGGALFLFFLDQLFGSGDGRFVYRLWVRAAASLPHVDSSIWMRIIEAETGVDFTDLILGFAAFRISQGNLRMFTVGSQHVHKLMLTRDDLPWPLGCVVLRIPPERGRQAFMLRVEHENHVGIAFLKSGPLVERNYFRLRGEESEWHLEPLQSLTLAICDLDKESHLRGDLRPKALSITFDFQKDQA